MFHKLRKIFFRRRLAEKITDAELADGTVFISGKTIDTEVLLKKFLQATVGLHINLTKTKFIALNTNGPAKVLDGSDIEKVNKFTYLKCRITSAEANIPVRIGNACCTLNISDKIWRFTLKKPFKAHFFRALVQSVVLKKLDNDEKVENALKRVHTRMLKAV